jgi:benzodiazapine receptor
MGGRPIGHNKKGLGQRIILSSYYRYQCSWGFRLHQRPHPRRNLEQVCYPYNTKPIHFRHLGRYLLSAYHLITVPFMVSCILNMAWIIAFSYVQIELSVLFIFGLVITLVLICRELLKGNDGKHWMLPLTFGTYTGWLLIATVVNTAAMLVKLNWSGFGIPADIWAIIVLVAAIILVTALLLRIRIAVFPLPVAWAYFGIYNYLRAPHGYKGEFVFLQNIALAGMVVLLALAAIQFYRNHVSLIPKS